MATKRRRKPIAGQKRVKNANGTFSIFKQETCTKSKQQAERNKKAVHNKGFRAMNVAKADGTICTFKGPKRKKVTAKKTGRRTSGSRRRKR